MKVLFLYVPFLGKELSGGSILEFFRIIGTLWYFFLTRKICKFKSDLKVTFIMNGLKIPVYLRYPMDIAVLREIFLDKEYDWFPMDDPKYIIDLGAHFGDTALYYYSKFPNAKIIAVEPSPENYERLVDNTKEISNIIPVQAAIGPIDGEVILNIVSSSLGHSTAPRKNTESTIKVPQISLETLFKQYAIQKADIIKFDIEGAEFDLLNNLELSKYSSAYIGEVHLDLCPDVSLETFLKEFDQFDVHINHTANPNRKLIMAKI